jgi:hypothetical protein
MDNRTALQIVLTFGIPVIICWLAVFGIKITNKYLDYKRRKQHPEYFKLFDEAVDISNEAHDVCTHKKVYFEHKLKLIYEGLQDGECTVEYFKEYLDRINKQYIEFATWFEEKNKEAKELFRKADFYAKEHDLRWGILY